MSVSVSRRERGKGEEDASFGRSDERLTDQRELVESFSDLEITRRWVRVRVREGENQWRLVRTFLVVRPLIAKNRRKMSASRRGKSEKRASCSLENRVLQLFLRLRSSSWIREALLPKPNPTQAKKPSSVPPREKQKRKEESFFAKLTRLKIAPNQPAHCSGILATNDASSSAR